LLQEVFTLKTVHLPNLCVYHLIPILERRVDLTMVASTVLNLTITFLPQTVTLKMYRVLYAEPYTHQA
jgi:hypothetical protein